MPINITDLKTEITTDDDFYVKKLASVNFYFAQVLPRHKGYLDCITNGAEIGIALNEECF